MLMNKLLIVIALAIVIAFAAIYYVNAQNTHSIDFEGDNSQAVSLEQTQLITQPLLSPWTIMAWINLESYHGTDRQMIFYDAETGAGEDSTIEVGIAGAAKALSCRFRVNTGEEASATSADNSISIGRWYHIACQRDGTIVRAFINGRLAASITTAGLGGDINATASRVPCIGALITASGCAAATAEVFDGKIDEVSFWRRALSEAEIQQRMRQELNATASTTVTQGLEAHWRFDNTIIDSVGRTAVLLETLVGTPAHSTDTGFKQMDITDF